MTKVLPRELTSYDLFKCAAVLLMIVDHVGYYFFPEQDWWRVFGRLCVPIWFFLIGYAQSRDLGPKLWGGMIILTVASMAAGMYVFPLNILATVIIVRLCIDRVAEHLLKDSRVFWSFNAVMMFVALPTMLTVEYGTMAVMLALFGWYMRKAQQGDPRVTPQIILNQMAVSMAVYVGWQYMMFQFSQPQMLVLTVGMLAVFMLLRLFRPVSIPGTGEGVRGALLAPVRVMGRYTLEIYVLHLLLFKALVLYTAPQTYQFMQWSWSALG